VGQHGDSCPVGGQKTFEQLTPVDPELEKALTSGHTQMLAVPPGVRLGRLVRQMAKADGWETDLAKGGVKFDTDKPRYDLFPPDAYDGICQVLTKGAVKYSEWNWLKGMSWSRVLASALRHIFSYMRGQDLDPETGLLHIDHAACCLVFLSTYHKRKLGVDDRYKG
jgi:dATP/dGTP diphosphohydrolase